ncbi:sporulation integral membrane protein YtvI [Gracilibacillus alcaliphilus]|uniref:sporulation integral membrane protein YtvI n=1 Tax=Gracilibacillus alcaliphilus TaxID=1401441 RepID=UPI001956AD9B|nr:sporulation integral membrane protein YtvI [Gracilibacillus alcaliphilus]MBM7676857.1 sporulation integral membrane protein YtvI [Gracilibacillus alcaliphilus]
MFNQRILKKIFIGLLVVAIGVFVYFYFSAFSPILLAFLTAVIFEPLVKLLQRYLKTKKRIWSVTIVFTTFVVVSSLLVYITLTSIINRIIDFSFQLPRYGTEIQLFINEIIANFNDMIADLPQRNAIISELERQSERLLNTLYDVVEGLVTLLGSWVQSIPNLIFVILVYLITYFLISLDLPRLFQSFYKLFSDEVSEKLKDFFQRLRVVFWGYWKAQFVLSIMIFVLTYVSLLFISPRVALIMTIIIWVVDIIPLYVGPALVLVPWALIMMLIGEMATGVQLIILTIGLLVIRRITEPKVLGDQMGLAALPTVLSMYFGFVFFGVLGLIFGPFVVSAFQAAKEAGLFQVVKRVQKQS